MYKPPLNFTVSDIDIFSMAALFDYLVFIEKIVEGYRLACAIRNTPTPMWLGMSKRFSFARDL